MTVQPEEYNILRNCERRILLAIASEVNVELDTIRLILVQELSLRIKQQLYNIVLAASLIFM
jgi:hypothetical protein